MSEIERFAPVIEGVPVCDAVAADCRCVLAPGHDGPHECEPKACGGRWSGSETGGDFKIHRLPNAPGGPGVLGSFLAGLGGDW